MDRSQVFEVIDYAHVSDLKAWHLDPSCKVLPVENERVKYEILVDATEMGSGWSRADRYFAEHSLREVAARRLKMPPTAFDYCYCSYQGAYALALMPSSRKYGEAQAYVLKAKNGKLLLIEKVPGDA